jgi:Tol biopolymer transport system component
MVYSDGDYSHTFRLDSTGQCCLPFRPGIVNPDGSDFTQLTITYGPFDMDCQAWTLDRARLLCAFGDQFAGVFSIRSSDGGDPMRLTTNPFGSEDLATDVSSDGTRFVFLRFKPSGGPTATPKPDAQVAVFVENLDGTGLRQLTPYLLADRASAKWFPDGKNIIVSTRNGIAFMLKGGLFSVRPDGTGLTPINLQVGTQKYSAFNPQWSPDGTRIIFNMFIKGGEGIFMANPDGSSVVEVKFRCPLSSATDCPADVAPAKICRTAHYGCYISGD